MMRRLAGGLMVLAVWLGLACPVLAGETPEQAKALALKAVDYYKAHGRDAAIVAFSDPKGEFVQGELYVFVFDKDGTLLINVNTPKLASRNMLQARDREGKYFVKEFLTAGPEGKWVDYIWPNPATHHLQGKTSFVVKADDLFIGCGAYKPGTEYSPEPPAHPGQ